VRIFGPIGILQYEFSSSVLRFLRRKFRSFRESKPRPFQNREESGTRKFKGWRTRQATLVAQERSTRHKDSEREKEFYSGDAKHDKAHIKREHCDLRHSLNQRLVLGRLLRAEIKVFLDEVLLDLLG
jgi:hypothetical protein